MRCVGRGSLGLDKGVFVGKANTKTLLVLTGRQFLFTKPCHYTPRQTGSKAGVQSAQQSILDSWLVSGRPPVGCSPASPGR